MVELACGRSFAVVFEHVHESTHRDAAAAVMVDYGLNRTDMQNASITYVEPLSDREFLPAVVRGRSIIFDNGRALVDIDLLPDPDSESMERSAKSSLNDGTEA